jgi:glycosyltransferase involved in cell wall biosynthesis
VKNSISVVHIVPSIARESSGPSYSVIGVCKSLIRNKLDIKLVALDLGTVPENLDFITTFRVGKFVRLGRSPSLFQWLYKKVKLYSVDILHNHSMWQIHSLYPGWLAKKFKVILVTSPRGTFSKWAMENGSSAKFMFWHILQKPALKSTQCFHATSLSEYKDIRRLGFKQPVAIIPNGIDIPKLPNKNEGSLKTLLFLGRIHQVKGLDLLLPAWQKLQSQFTDWQLKVVGSDDDYYGKTGYLKEMQNLSSKLNLQNIKFTGELHGAEKLQAYRDADLFILPSYSENFGVTVAEALSSSTPVVTTRGTPWSGLQSQGAGWWVNADIESLSECMEEALKLSSAELEEMGIRGREWMKSDYSWNEIGNKMTKTYQWLHNDSEATPSWVKLN